MKPRPYQEDIERAVEERWAAGDRNVLAVLPTGAGKTFVAARFIRRNKGPAVAIAHRQELVGQISLALAREGIRHRIIGPKSVVKLCVSIHMHEVGKNFYHADAPVAVAGVDTLIRRKNLDRWARSVTLWFQDEAHHVLRDNKWGAAAQMFPNARGLGVTATPLRADGKGLGREYDGLFDSMVEGPGMRDLINLGYLTDYRLIGPPSDIDMTDVRVGTSGDYVHRGLVTAVRRSKIVGDVVTHYKRFAAGKLGVTFATDVETAAAMAAQYNAEGIPAAVVSAKTPDRERVSILRRFKNRELLQLVNVDIFGEGFDLPAIEVVSMARPTCSYGLFVQQFGRALRPLKGKQRAVILDHVGNCTDRHGVPDRPRVWSLAPRSRSERGGASDVIPTRSCPACYLVYERIHKSCPYCGHTPTPVSRSGPEFVDGDLTELDDAALARLRGDIAAIDQPAAEYQAHLAARNVPPIGQLAHTKRHRARQESQHKLRTAIAQWAGYQRATGRPDSESYRRFYFTYGIDVLSAQALGITEAGELYEQLVATFEPGWSPDGAVGSESGRPHL